ncbi:MAG: macro domain-containing protein [Myxococcota bacterium]
MDLRRGARWGAVWLGLALAGPAQARDVPLLSGDVAFTYGRNWQQELNVAGIAGELKLNLLPYLAVGVRTGGALGGGLGREEGARGYAGLPLILKAEATPLATKVRPYVGLGLGVTRVAAGGAVVVLQTDVRNSRSWSITGPMPTSAASAWRCSMRRSWARRGPRSRPSARATTTRRTCRARCCSSAPTSAGRRAEPCSRRGAVALRGAAGHMDPGGSMAARVLVEHRPHGRLELVQGDIVEQHVDALVSAANTKLSGGGGVDGALHHAAGPALLDACRALPADPHGRRCATGDVRVTPAFELPARWVIHAVGPFYDERYRVRAEQLLQQVHRRALSAAIEAGARSVAFPAISTGAYRFPLEAAARIAMGEAAGVLDRPSPLHAVRFVLRSDAAFEAFAALATGEVEELQGLGQLPLL